VSLSWRERVVVGLAPERLSALCLGGWLRPRLLDRHAVVIQRQDDTHWEKSLDALEALLSEPAWRGKDIVIILSAHYTRHVLVPTSPGMAEDELMAVAQLVFRETYGDLAQDWDVTVSPPASGQPTIACAVPHPLLAALRSVSDSRGRLRTIQPSLMPVFNRARRIMGDAAGCLALVEPRRVTLASVENGQWKYVDTRAGDGNILPQFLLEESELHGRQPGGILWLCDLTDSAHLPPETFWSHQPIHPRAMAGVDAGAGLAAWGVG